MNEFTNKVDVTAGGSSGIGLAAPPGLNELSDKYFD